MARPRTPTAVLEARGAFIKNPQRARERENEPASPAGLGSPPAAFLIQAPDSGYQEAERLRGIWEEIAHDGPWLDSGNRLGVESLCRITNNIRRGSGKLSQLVLAQAKLLNDLGLTQASRSKVNAPSATSERGASAWQALAEESRRPRVA